VTAKPARLAALLAGGALAAIMAIKVAAYLSRLNY